MIHLHGSSVKPTICKNKRKKREAITRLPKKRVLEFSRTIKAQITIPSLLPDPGRRMKLSEHLRLQVDKSPRDKSSLILFPAHIQKHPAAAVVLPLPSARIILVSLLHYSIVVEQPRARTHTLLSIRKCVCLLSNLTSGAIPALFSHKSFGKRKERERERGKGWG